MIPFVLAAAVADWWSRVSASYIIPYERGTKYMWLKEYPRIGGSGITQMLGRKA